MLELRVSRVLKGNSETSTLRTASVIGPCRLDVDVDATYVVFAVAASSAWSESDQVDPAARLYGVLGRPLPASRRVIRQVVDYAQNGGESTPYCHLCRYSAFVALANLRYINALNNNNNNNNNNGILRWARLARVMHRPSVRPSVCLSMRSILTVTRHREQQRCRVGRLLLQPVVVPRWRRGGIGPSKSTHTPGRRLRSKWR